MMKGIESGRKVGCHRGAVDLRGGSERSKHRDALWGRISPLGKLSRAGQLTSGDHPQMFDVLSD